MLTTRTLTSLETIYEESASFVGSTISSPHNYIDETINGLISARTIPSVDIERQRAYENHRKPPIEVQFRDGSKRYIHPSTTTSMIINRRNLLDSSSENLSSKKIVSNINFHRKNFHRKKPPLVLTIITAEDLRQAGITSNASSSSSSDTSDLSSRTNTPNKSIKSIEDIHQAVSKQLSPVLTNSSLSLSQHSLQQQQQIVINDHESLNSSRSFSDQSFIISNPIPKFSTPSIRVTLTNDENEKNSTLNSILSNKTVNGTSHPNTTILFQERIRSAFRPFLKSVRFNPETSLIKPRIPSTNTLNSTQQQQIVPSFQQYLPISTQSSTKQTNSTAQKYSIIPTNSSLNINSIVQIKPSISHQQSNLTKNHLDQSLIFPHLLNLSTNSGQTFSSIINPNIQWLNITSNSIYDIPHLSSKYSNIPLRITLPIAYNQGFVIKHNPILEQRLLNAGLSPETIALYERILDVAEKRPMNIISPRNIINQNPYKFFI